MTVGDIAFGTLPAILAIGGLVFGLRYIRLELKRIGDILEKLTRK